MKIPMTLENTAVIGFVLALSAVGCNASAVKTGGPSANGADAAAGPPAPDRPPMTTPMMPPPVTSIADGGLKNDVRPSAQSCGLTPGDPLGNAPPVCKKVTPLAAYAPVLKWMWDAPPQDGAGGGNLHVPGSYVIPLVGNFTDDDGNGRIDLCDVPDVIVTTQGFVLGQGVPPKEPNMYMLAGDTGKLEVTFEATVDHWVTPAFGDLDGDGLPDVVSVDWEGHMVAHDHKGKVKWKSPQVGLYHAEVVSTCHAMAIYDLNGDGKPEIISAFEVYDNTGHRLFNHDVKQWEGGPLGNGKWKDGKYHCPANIAADLDGDGKLEVIFGNAAYRADGTLYWKIPGPPGQPQVANFDDDPEPEVLVVSVDGVSILEHDGKIKFGPVQMFPTKEESCNAKPAVVQNLDGTGRNDIMFSTCDRIGGFRVGATSIEPLWSYASARPDGYGYATGTAFDFLGRGVADAVWDEKLKLMISDGKTGTMKFGTDRFSTSFIEYPVVVDVDNDGSVDILDVANGGGDDERFPTLRVYQDAEKRWMPGRRVWNQHAYHVTNVREDGTIPAQMPKNWQMANTFRANLQYQEPKCSTLVD